MTATASAPKKSITLRQTIGALRRPPVAMMLALGDAIAVALLERNGFTAEHFQVLHPGGKLGRTLLRVSDLMDTGDAIPLAPPSMVMSEVILVMTAVVGGDGTVVWSCRGENIEPKQFPARCAAW